MELRTHTQFWGTRLLTTLKQRASALAWTPPELPQCLPKPSPAFKGLASSPLPIGPQDGRILFVLGVLSVLRYSWVHMDHFWFNCEWLMVTKVSNLLQLSTWFSAWKFPKFPLPPSVAVVFLTEHFIPWNHGLWGCTAPTERNLYRMWKTKQNTLLFSTFFKKIVVLEKWFNS